MQLADTDTLVQPPQQSWCLRPKRNIDSSRRSELESTKLLNEFDSSSSARRTTTLLQQRRRLAVAYTGPTLYSTHCFNSKRKSTVRAKRVTSCRSSNIDVQVADTGPIHPHRNTWCFNSKRKSTARAERQNRISEAAAAAKTKICRGNTGGADDAGNYQRMGNRKLVIRSGVPIGPCTVTMSLSGRSQSPETCLSCYRICLRVR